MKYSLLILTPVGALMSYILGDDEFRSSMHTVVGLGLVFGVMGVWVLVIAAGLISKSPEEDQEERLCQSCLALFMSHTPSVNMCQDCEARAIRRQLNEDLKRKERLQRSIKNTLSHTEKHEAKV